MNHKTLLAMLGAGVLLAAGCSGPAQSASNAAEGEDGVIRFTFSPDPAWDWIQDQGILEEMEKDSGYRILQTVTWDEFGQFAGGHDYAWWRGLFADALRWCFPREAS